MRLWKRRTLERPIYDDCRFKESRTVPRFSASDIPDLKIITAGEEPEKRLINISRRGVLMESREHRSPGSRISLKLAKGEKIYSVTGRVIGQDTSSMNNELFKIAVAFDEEFPVLTPSCM